MKKNDLALIAALLLLCGIGAIFFALRTDDAVRHAVITQDGTQLYDTARTRSASRERAFLSSTRTAPIRSACGRDARRKRGT